MLAPVIDMKKGHKTVPSPLMGEGQGGREIHPECGVDGNFDNLS